MPLPRLVAQRLSGHALSTPVAGGPAEVVQRLLAVQAQDAAGARWAVGVRLGAGRTEAVVEQSLDEGRLLRTHALRGTWQLVAPGDVRALLGVSATRVRAGLAGRLRQLELAAGVLTRARGVLERAVAGGPRTREELRGALETSGIGCGGQRLSHLLLLAELDQVTISGPRVEGQPTWVAFDARVPPGRPVPGREELLAEVARRYLVARGPARPRDFAWWVGSTLTEARRAFAALGPELVEEDGALHRRSVEPGPEGPPVHLLPPFDEYLVGYAEREDVLAARDVRRVNAGGGMLSPVLAWRGRVVGTWRRELTRREVRVEPTWFDAAVTPPARALDEAVQRYARFLGRTPVVSVAKAPARREKPAP